MIVFRRSCGLNLKVLSCLLLMESAVNAWMIDKDAGIIFSNIKAKSICPDICHNFQVEWKGQWVTKIPGRMSVCGCVFSTNQLLQYLNIISTKDDGKKIINAYQFNELCKAIQNEDSSTFSEDDGLKLYQWFRQNFSLIIQDKKVVYPIKMKIGY